MKSATPLPTLISLGATIAALAGQTPVEVVISEIAAATNENMGTPSYDAVELYNPTDTPADVSHWLVADGAGLGNSFRIPAGTVIPPGGHYVVFEDIDTNQPLDEITYDLSLDSFGINAGGEKVYLASADAERTLTGYVAIADPPSSTDGQTLGRYVNSVGVENYLATSEPTLGRPNAPPEVGDLVFSELLIDPADGSALPEFIELANLTDHTIPLSNAHPIYQGWLIGYAPFPPISYVPARGSAVLVPPATDVAAFRAEAALPLEVPVIEFGNWGALDNSGEKLELHRTARHVRGNFGVDEYMARVDHVDYQTTAPWPSGTVNFGFTLERSDLTGVGNDPASWRASSGVDGTPGSYPGAPTTAEFPDAGLAGAVRAALGIGAGAPVDIATLRTLTTLNADGSGIADLSWIEYATSLENLSLRDNDIIDPHALLSLPNLVSLDLSENRINRLHVPVIDKLRVRGVTVNDDSQKGGDVIVQFGSARLGGLVRREAGIASEEDLYAVDCYPITELAGMSQGVVDLTGLEMLPNLRRLRLEGSTGEDGGGPFFHDLTPLAGLTKLESLDIDRNSVSDLSPLAGLTHLTHFSALNNRITDLSPLAGLTELRYLNVNTNPLNGDVDLTPLAGLTKLRHLDLGRSIFNTGATDLSPLAGLTDLVVLDVSDAEIQEPAVLGTLTSLASLAVGRNDFEDLSFLATLPGLRKFNFDQPFHLNGLSTVPPDISPIVALPKLQVLSLWNFDGADLSAVLAMPRLSLLDLRFNDLTDISPVLRQLIPKHRSLDSLDISWNWLDTRPGSASRAHIEALRDAGIAVSAVPQTPYHNPLLKLPDLTIALLPDGKLAVSWIAERMIPSMLEVSTDLETWTPFTGTIYRPDSIAYLQAEVDLGASGAEGALHFRVRQ